MDDDQEFETRLAAMDQSEAPPFGSWNVDEIATTLDHPSLIERLTLGKTRRLAAKVLRQMWHAGYALMDRLAQAEAAHEIVVEQYEKRLDAMKERHDHRIIETRREAESIRTRIELAIDELLASKGRHPGEEPVAIILSPYQYERMTWTNGSVKSLTSRRSTRFRNIPIYTASGCYGPLVLTEKGMDGLSRQAPELLLTRK